MTLAPGLQLRTGQSLVMTPQLQHTIHLLTLTNQELDVAVTDAVAGNPLLEDGGGDDGADAAAVPDTMAAVPDDAPLDLTAATEARAGEDGDTPAGPRLDAGAPTGTGEAFDFDRLESAGPGLHDHLLAQASHALAGPELAVAAHLIAHIDEAGYLTEPLADVSARLGVPLAMVEAVLAVVHTFDPTGVGARDLAECLALQLREADRCDPCMATLLANLPLLAAGARSQLRRLCGVDDDDLTDMIREVRACDPKPGLRFGGEAAVAVEPDLFVTETRAGWSVELNAATLPRPVVNRAYYLELRVGIGKADRAWLDERLADATWLIRTLD